MLTFFLVEKVQTKDIRDFLGGFFGPENVPKNNRICIHYFFGKYLHPIQRTVGRTSELELFSFQTKIFTNWSESRHVPIRDLPCPQCQPNQTYCTAGEELLTCCAGLWARAQACHQNRKKKKISWSYGFEARSRAAADFTFLQAGGPAFGRDEC